MKCLVSKHMYFIWAAQSYFFYQRNRSIVHGGERDTPSEAVVSLRTVTHTENLRHASGDPDGKC